jgi:hypothetical protein
MWVTTLAFSLVTSKVQAIDPYALTAGGFITAQSSTYPTGGTTLLTDTSPFNNGAISGTLVSKVISGDASNPYGGLTFTYQLSINAGSPDSSSSMTVSSYDNYSTDVSYNNLGGEVNPLNFSRDSNGATVRFLFSNPSIGPGSTGALVVVQTGAPSYQNTMAGIIDGLTVNVASLAPLTVPEPGLGAFLLAGLGVLALRLRSRG